MRERAMSLKEFNIKITEDIKLILEEINHIAQAQKVDIYLVGGFVRDLLLYRENKDLDFVIIGNYIHFVTELHNRIGGSLKIHERFLTGNIVIDNKINIDIARARKECYPTSGSLPLIREGSLVDDLRRRDFTINTLLLDFKDLNNLRVYDYFNGTDDIIEKKIKILHNKSFKDDPTRIYRGIKLAIKLDFDIEDKTLLLIRNAINNGYINNVSINRLFNEVIKCMEEKDSFKILKALSKYQLLNFICDGSERIRNAICFIEQFEERSSFVTRQLKVRKYNSRLVKLMLLLHGIDSDSLKAFFDNISIPKVMKEKNITFSKSHKQVINKLKSNYISDYDIYNLLKKIGVEEIICYIIISGFDHKLVKRIKQYLFNLKYIKIYITGEEIKKMGIVEGPVYSILLEKTKEKIINEKYIHKEQQIMVLRKIIMDWKEGNNIEYIK